MKKVLSLILALAMVLTFMPVQVHAASGTRTISGTLTFSSPVEEATEIDVYAEYAYGSFWDLGAYKTIKIEKGVSKANFSLEVSPDIYYLAFDGENYLNYGVEDDLTEEWEQRAVFDLHDKSVTGLSVNGDALLGSGSSGSNVNVVINLPEALTKDKRFVVTAEREDGSTRNTRVRVKAGEKSINVSYSLNLKKKYRFSFADITNGSNGYEEFTGRLYGAESGVTFLESNSKLYEVSNGATVTIGYPSCYTISGTLNRSGYADGVEAAAYVTAEFADGERYADRIVFDASTKTNSFKIYVPQSQKGKAYTLYTAPAYNLTDTGVMKEKEKSVATGTLNGDYSAETVTMESYKLNTYTGTVSLPGGVTAPSGGMYVYLYSNTEGDYSDFGEFEIPAGSSSTSFSFPAVPGLSVLSAGLSAPVAGVFYETSTKVSGTSGIKLSFPKEAVISGTVYLPDGVDTAYAGEMLADTAKGNFWSNFSIRHGEKSSKYYVHVPLNTELSLALYMRYDGSGKISEDDIYIDSDWQQSSDYAEGISVTGDKSGVDIRLEGTKTLSGRLVSDNGDAISIASANNKPWIWLYDAETDEQLEDYQVDIASDGTWTASIPSSYNGQYYLQFSLNNIESNIVTNNSYYYAAGKVATSRSDATAVDFSADSVSGLDFYVTTGYVLTGNITIPAGGYFNKITSDRWNPYVNVSLRNTDTYQSYYTSVQMNPNSKTWGYRIVVPKENGTYECFARGNSEIAEYFDTNVAIIGETPKVNVSVSGNTTIPILTFPLVKATISGTISRPAGIPGNLNVEVHVATAKDSYEMYTRLREKDSADFSVQIPDTDDSATYTLSYYTYSSGLKTGTWYLKSDGTFSRNMEDAAAFTVADHTHDFTPVPIDPFVKGKMYLPETVDEDSSVYLSLNGYFKTNSDYNYSAYASYSVDVENVKTDSKGRYIEYVLGNESITEGGKFYLYYNAENDALDCSTLYVLSEDTVGQPPEDRYSFTFDGTTPVTLDFTLLPWDDGNRYVFESAHGLQGETVTYTYTYPSDCDSLTFTFNDRSNEWITINGTKYSTNDPVTIESRTAEFAVEFGDYNYDRYGFACTDIKAAGVKKEKSGVSAIYTKKGGNEVIEEVKNSKEISATICTDGIAPGTELNGHAILYDAEGRFLGISKADTVKTDDSGNVGLDLKFDEVSSDAAKVTVIFIDKEFKPLGESDSREGSVPASAK